MHLAVLGPTTVLVDGEPVDLGTRKQRALLAALAMHRPRPVGVDALMDLLWEGTAPPGAMSSLHGYVARLRRVLEPERGVRAPAGVLVTVEPGYALRMADEAVDVAGFVAAVEGVHRRLADVDSPIPAAPAELAPAELGVLADRLDAALALWRGEPYTELGESTAVVAERVRLGELHLIAREDRALLRTELGEHATAAAELGTLVQQYPLRERLWALQALALARAGRQGDALAALREVRGLLVDELGVDPGESLRAVEAAVLAQGPAVVRPSPRPAVGVARTASALRTAGGTGDRTDARVGGAADDPRRLPLVDRDAELDRLARELAHARAGRTSFAMLVGEAGIGKSRLVAELTRLARADGFTVVAGHCSADEGAPPYWPWLQVVRSLGAIEELSAVDTALLEELTPGGAAGLDRTATSTPPSVESERFQLAEALRRLLAAGAARRPLLVVLEDLQWADRSSLRLLRHLVENLVDVGVLVIVTRRSHPEPDGVLADVGEALGRRHALRLDLTGLSEDGVAGLVRLATGQEAAASVVTSLRERTEGNPFFLVELVRLMQDAESGALFAQSVERVIGQIPAAVSDVVSARVARLPEYTRDLLQTAAVLGREFHVGDLSAAADQGVEAVMDGLDPALAAGIVVEEPSAGELASRARSRVGWFRFAHALVREVLYEAQSGTRRARRHAAVAAALGQRGAARLAETARHWLAAGPAHVATAWRCAEQAADQAQRQRGYEEAGWLLAAAVAAQGDDHDCGPAERYDLLMAYAEACRLVGDRDGQLDALNRAVREAEALDDVDRLARAAVSSADGSLWTVRPMGVVHQPAVDALHRVLRELPGQDSELRCRALLTLSGELHYADAGRERDALAAEGLAMAQRLGDPDLRGWAAATAFVAIWEAANAPGRWQMADEALDADAGFVDQVTRAHLLTLRAVADQETGRIAEMWSDLTLARELAQRLRLPFAQLVLTNLELPWRAMQGGFAVAERLADGIATLPVSVQPRELLQLSAQLYSLMWQGRAAELLPRLRSGYAAQAQPYLGLYLLALARAEERDEARTVADRGLAPLLRGNPWSATYDLAVVAHIAYVIDQPHHASAAYELLARYAGRPACAGSGGALGPVDGYLALAAAAAGERDIAGRHADDAAALAVQWEVPRYAQWLTDLRGRAGW